MAQCASLIAPYGLRSRVGRAGSGRMMNRLTSKQPRTTALLLAAISLAAPNSSTVAESRPCRAMEYERSAYTICEVDLRQQTIKLYWRRPDGTPYAYLSALPRALEGEAGKLLFATNAGMFDPVLKPVGLYVEQGRELAHAHTRSKPNGVFYLSADRAAVAETGAFLKQRAPPSEKAIINPRSVERERPVGD